MSSADTVVSMGRVRDLDFHIRSLYIRLRYFVSACVSNMISILVLLISSGIKTCTANCWSKPEYGYAVFTALMRNVS